MYLRIVLLSGVMNLDVFYWMTHQGGKLAQVKPGPVILSGIFIGTWQILVLYVTQGLNDHMIGHATLNQISEQVLSTFVPLLYLALGMYFLHRGSKVDELDEVAHDSFDLKVLSRVAGRTSVDASFIGLALALSSYQVKVFSPYIFAFSVLAVILGVYYGRYYGQDNQRKSLTIAGILFILMGVSIV